MLAEKVEAIRVGLALVDNDRQRGEESCRLELLNKPLLLSNLILFAIRT